MDWNLDDSRPIWPQLKEELMRQIISKNYNTGGHFPTVRELAADAGVNRNTMQRAMAELEAEGLLVTNRTSGRTVTTDEKLIEEIKERLARQNIEKFLSEMAAIGYTSKEVASMIQEKGLGNREIDREGIEKKGVDNK